MVLVARILAFLVFKIELRVRRRYSILERLLFRFRFGQVLFGKLYLAVFALDLLGSTGLAVAVYVGLQQVSFTAGASYICWQWFYFALLVLGCFWGLQVTGRALFPEDLQLLSRLPVSRMQLSFFIFAEHLSSTVASMFFLVVVPIGIPLLLTTRNHVSDGIALVTTILVFLLALLIGFLAALLICLLRYHMLKHGTFSKTLLSQIVLAVVASGIFCGFTVYALGHFADWLRQMPSVNFASGDLSRVAEWLNLGLAQFGELLRNVGAVFHYSFWPFNLGVGLIHNFGLSNLGLILVEIVIFAFLTALLTKRFRGYSLAEVTKIRNRSRTDEWIYGALNRLTSGNSGREILFRKNLLLTFRHLENVHSAGPDSLIGGTGIWILMGILGGVGNVFSQMPFAGGWQMFAAVPVMMLLLFTVQARVFYDLRYLLSVDGEGRNICLLRLAKVCWTDLFACRVRLLRVVTLPALLTFVLVLGFLSRWTVEYFLCALLSALFIYVNLPKVLLLSSMAAPRFEAAHFEESGEFFEQKLSEEGSWFIFLVLCSIVPLVCFGFAIIGFLSVTAYLGVVISFCGLATAVVHLVSRITVEKLGVNIKQAEGIL